MALDSLLEGAFNFRDLGGLPRADGRQTRHGVLFRGDTLQALTPGDATFLQNHIGLRAVIDLRLEHEVAEQGRGILGEKPGIAFVNAPLEMASTDGIAPEQVMDHLYARCLASDSLPGAIERIAEFAGQPTVFHCAAGKDRTGVVAAIVLSLVGVNEEAIIADYLRSAAAMPHMVERFQAWPRYREHLAAMPPAVYAVEEAPIRRLLATVKSEFGDVRNWAVRSGISTSALSALKTHLLEAP